MMGRYRVLEQCSSEPEAPKKLDKWLQNKEPPFFIKEGGLKLLG